LSLIFVSRIEPYRFNEDILSPVSEMPVIVLYVFYGFCIAKAVDPGLSKKSIFAAIKIITNQRTSASKKTKKICVNREKFLPANDSQVFHLTGTRLPAM